MTLPDERFRALKQGKKLLEEIAYRPEKTPHVSSLIRHRARVVLRHYPADYHFEDMVDACPEILQKPSNSSRINNKQSNNKE